MKIINILLKTLPFGGGIEKYVEEIGPRLVKMGHEVIVYTMDAYGDGDAEFKGMKIKRVKTFGGKNTEKIIGSFMAILDVLMNENADIVHFHAFAHLFPFLLKMKKNKILIQGHGIEWKRLRWGFWGKMVLKICEKICVLSSGYITVVSYVQKEYLKYVYQRDSKYIPTGINIPVKSKPKLIKKKWGLEGKDYVLFLSRLVPEKGAHHLISAFNMLKTDIKLVVAGSARGEEEYYSQLKKMSEGNGRVIFAGPVSGKLYSELMTNPLLFVLPSEIEGLPTVLLEALSYGNCCLVSDIPENLEALKKYGLTFKNKSVENLKTKLEFLTRNKKSAGKYRLKNNARILSEHSWDLIAKEFNSLYLRIKSGDAQKEIAEDRN